MRQRRLMSCYRIAAKQRVDLLATLLVTAPGPEWTLYLRSCGPVHIGMTLPDVRRVLEDPRARLHNFGLDPGLALDRCAYLDSWALPPGLGLMFDRGRVVRIDVSSVAIRTASGVGVGSSEARIRAVYPGRIRAEPHQYVPDGNYLWYSPADAADRGLAVVFETEAGKVTSFRTGTQEAVALVEGCS